MIGWRFKRVRWVFFDITRGVNTWINSHRVWTLVHWWKLCVMVSDLFIFFSLHTKARITAKGISFILKIFFRKGKSSMTQIFIGKLNILTASKAYLQMQSLNDFSTLWFKETCICFIFCQIINKLTGADVYVFFTETEVEWQTTYRKFTLQRLIF